MTKKQLPAKGKTAPGYDAVLSGVAELLEAARRTSARATNAIMTATYWEIGRRIVEYEQGGAGRATYGELLLRRLSGDLLRRFGRGFGLSNLKQIRKFYLNYEDIGKGQTLSGQLIATDKGDKSQAASAQFSVGLILCAQKDHAVAKYALGGLPNKVLAAEYKTVLPDEKTLAQEIERSRKMLERRREIKK